MAQVQALVASPSGTRYALWRTRYLVWGDGELTLRRLTLANRTARSRATSPQRFTLGMHMALALLAPFPKGTRLARANHRRGSIVISVRTSTRTAPFVDCEHATFYDKYEIPSL